jgi:GntR family transcriptional regulator, N-acetylglucosamine utilization regulator
MDNIDFRLHFDSSNWYRPKRGARYVQLYRYISSSISNGAFVADTQLPAEREIAEFADVSRVTVRKAMSKLVQEGALVRRQGAGSFVSSHPGPPKLEQSLSALTSFTEYMQRRGMVSTSLVLETSKSHPTPDEMVKFGLGPSDFTSRIKRVRSADGVPMAIETSCLPSDILNDPGDVTTSIYAVLRKLNLAPVRAIQRINATNVNDEDAKILGLTPGEAVLTIQRTAYLKNGRPVEFTAGIYRSDIYDFVAELRLDEH